MYYFPSANPSPWLFSVQRLLLAALPVTVMIRTLLLLAFTGLLGLSVSSCINPPEYPKEPSISFNSIKAQRVNLITGIYDTITVTVDFKDGDGDLGLSNDETQPPYQELNSDGTRNKYYNNYFFTPQVRQTNGSFVDLPLPSNFNYNSRFPRLAPNEKEAPLKGDLSFGQKFFLGSFPSGSVVRFKVKIVDRALNESNEIVTDQITIP
jgi:hypothetical protein